MVEKGFHYDIGELRCTVFSDGTITNLESQDAEVFGLNCMFIDSGNHKILIDTGAGGGFQSTAGRLVENLEAEGINCSDIDRIIITHGHVDHVGGCFSSQGCPVFPNALYITAEKEWAYWQAKPGTNEVQNMLFTDARKNLLPLADRFYLSKDNAEVLSGIKLLPAHGHTSGNIMIDIIMGHQRIFCIGDVIHSQVDFVNPAYLSLFDVDVERAIATRARVLSEIANKGILVFACHFQFPGLGYIVKEGNHYDWQPV
jgi:glyoxylase-like metal-dependent hydrolase (beta-lactamase superfamily II)